MPTVFSFFFDSSSPSGPVFVDSNWYTPEILLVRATVSAVTDNDFAPAVSLPT